MNAPSTQEITLKLNVDQINIVLEGLGELKAKVALPILETIRGQAMLQLSQMQEQPSVEAPAE